MPVRFVFALTVALVSLPAASQSLSVVATSPAMNATAAGRTAPVTVTFSEALDAATVTPARVRVVGRWTGPVAGTVTASGAALTFTPARPYGAGETVTVQLAAAIETASGESIGVGRGLTFWAASGPGTLDQTALGSVAIRRPGEGGIVTYGGIGIDLDGDRFNDFVVTNEATDDVRVFRNDGTGRYADFSVVPLPDGSVPSPLESGDFNGDGHLDVAVANLGNDRVSVLLGDGAGGFPTGASYPAGMNVRGLAVLDADGDGHDDLLTGHLGAGTVAVLRGVPDGTFAAPALVPVAGVTPHGLAVADFDEDGRLDAALADFGGEAVVILRADGVGSFAEAGRQAAVGSPWMIAAGDIDGDGHADVVATGAFAGITNVFWGDGAGGFSGVTPIPAGSFQVAIDLGDLDGDGDLDVVSSNLSSREWVVTETLAGRTFGAPRRLAVPGGASCATLHDRDDDGDLDLTGIDEVDDRIYLFDNVLPVGTSPDASAELRLALDGPNPARGSTALTVSLGPSTEGRLTLVDALGRVALDLGSVREGRVGLGLDGLAAGVYVARLDAGGEVRTVRIAVAR